MTTEHFNKLADALEIVQQSFREVSHATSNPNWFTGGAQAATSHRLMWQRKGAEAARESIDETIAILRAAAGADVAGLMAMADKMAERYSIYDQDVAVMGKANADANHANLARAALESALRVAMAPKAQWQPIETAPKDGTDILLAIIDAEHSYIDHVERGYFEVVAEDEEDGPWDIRDGEPWCSYEGRSEGLYWCYACGPDDFNRRGIRFLDYSDSAKYTHWMPLPPLPAAAQPGAQEPKP